MQRRKYALLKQPFELDALGDVSLTNPVLGDVMYYDGSFWINTPYAELVDDRVAALLVAGNNIDITYNDGAGTITIDVEALTSADVTDFNEAVDDRVGSLLVAGSNITLTYNDGANTLTVAAATPALNDLTDVDTTGVADGEALIYDSGTSTWVAGAVAGSSPTTTAGDIIIRGASADERLAIGSEGDVLTVASGAPVWAAPTGGGGGGGGDELRATQVTKFDVVSNTAFQDSSLSLSLTPGTWLIRLNIAVESNSAPAMEWKLDYTGTVTSASGNLMRIREGSAYSITDITTLPLVQPLTTTDTTQQMGAFVLVVSTTGTLKIQARQQTSSATAVSIHAGSWITACPTSVAATDDQFVYKAANTTRASTTTLADDPDLTTTLDANSVYEFEFCIFTKLASSPGIKLTPAFSGTTTWVVAELFLSHNNTTDYSASGVGSVMNQAVSNALPITVSTSGLNLMALWKIKGMISVGASGGTFSLQWAQQASSGTAARVDRGSFLRVKKVA